MTLPQAIAYFQKNAGIDYETARGEATRFAMGPGQAIDYLVGKTQIETLLGLVRDREGAASRCAPSTTGCCRTAPCRISTIRYEWLGDDALAAAGRSSRWPRRSFSAVAMPRITGGSLGSRKLRSPKGMHVRPTPGRVKESLFSILMDRLEGARVLDLFAGTGAIGFEAASRGAARVVSVEGAARDRARNRRGREESRRR